VVNETLIGQLIGSTASHLFQLNSFHNTSPNHSAASDNYEIWKNMSTSLTTRPHFSHNSIVINTLLSNYAKSQKLAKRQKHQFDTI